MSQELQKQTESPNSLALSHPQNKLIGNWIKSEAEYQVALTYGEKKIRDYNREDMTKLVEVMAKWRILLGVTTESTDQELIIICQFVYDNFKNFSLSDISLAMNWAIAGKIDLGFVSQKTISSYYVSKALNTYEQRKRELVNEIALNRENYITRESLENPKAITSLERAEIFKEHVITLYKSYMDGGLFYDINDSLYNWLKSQKMINPTKEQINAALNYAEDKYKESQKGDSLKSTIEKGLRSRPKEDEIKKLAREWIIMQKFEELTIGEILSKIKPEQFEK